jgi:hypothetical protein
MQLQPGQSAEEVLSLEIAGPATVKTAKQKQR